MIGYVVPVLSQAYSQLLAPRVFEYWRKGIIEVSSPYR
jgi:hypothetical protein